ncbi:RNA 2',3'-cyclic phosphodiesterase [bacterium]|nr:RNA 2',3'-cyclic phosphodiesterase [bacterium]
MNQTEIIRAFIAIDTPESAKSAIKLIQDKLKNIRDAKVTWVKPQGVHLTLKFLGDIRKSQIPEISACLRNCAKAVPPFELTSTTCGAFPGLKRPRILWLGLDGGQQLIQLQLDIRKSLDQLGFDPDNKEYHPHLTVGRVRSIESDSRLTSIYKEITFPQIVWQAFDVRLMSSTLKPSGAEYEVIERYEFKTN